jgi:hypothetical protein
MGRSSDVEELRMLIEQGSPLIPRTPQGYGR